jgi:hypothetical protein
MLIFMGGATDPGNIFVINKVGENWAKPSILANTLNSKYLESTASITPDGKTIYFASDRLGGAGGLDIFKIELQANGAAELNRKEIREALQNLMKERTTFVIAHRLNTIIHADRILVVEGGTIVEAGRHDELLRKGGRYAAFYRLQVREQESAPIPIASNA